jgi:hypothetical protein
MWHTGMEDLNEVTMRNIFCLVDTDHCLRTTGWLYHLGIRKVKLFPEVGDRGLIGNISTFQYKQWLVTPHGNWSSILLHQLPWKFLYKTHIYFSKLLLFVSRHVNGTFSVIWSPQHVSYLKWAYYMRMSISENIALLIKVHKNEKNLTTSSASFYKLNFFL